MTRHSGKTKKKLCPKCKSSDTGVLETGSMGNGLIVRKRHCKACNYRWFTGQDPEYQVPEDNIFYINGKPAIRQERLRRGLS